MILNSQLGNWEYGGTRGVSNGRHAQRYFSKPVLDLSRLSLTPIWTLIHESKLLSIALRLDNLGSVKEHEYMKTKRTIYSSINYDPHSIRFKWLRGHKYLL